MLKFQSISFASCHLFPGILTEYSQCILIKSTCRYLFCYGEFATTTSVSGMYFVLKVDSSGLLRNISFLFEVGNNKAIVSLVALHSSDSSCYEAFQFKFVLNCLDKIHKVF